MISPRIGSPLKKFTALLLVLAVGPVSLPLVVSAQNLLVVHPGPSRTGHQFVHD